VRRPWTLQACFVRPHNNTMGDWYPVESYASEERAQTALDVFKRTHRLKRFRARIRVREADDFAQWWADREFQPVERLAERGLTVVKCDCDDDRCYGWRMEGLANASAHDGG
jgi:hypothetical protein